MTPDIKKWLEEMHKAAMIQWEADIKREQGKCTSFQVIIETEKGMTVEEVPVNSHVSRLIESYNSLWKK